MEDTKSAKFVYYALIGTFVALYLAVAFVSTLHAITFFELANSLTLAIFLGAAFEIGQASVLFSILMTKNKHRTLAWAMMFLLTTLQITANVFASFKFMDMSGSTDWQYWQRSILFWLEADTPEIYKVTIAWITGAILPIVALGMTALAADNIKLNHEDVDLDYDEEDYDQYQDYNGEEEKYDGPFDEEPKPEGEDVPHIAPPNFDLEKTDEGVDKKPVSTRKPVNKPRGWHFKKEFIDDDGNVFSKGIFTHKSDVPKK